MLRGIRARLTYANVVATAALFIALGGSAAAAVIVSSNSQIAKNTVAGHHPSAGDHPNIIGNSITGADILESSLGKVPSAALADQATTANHAKSAGTATSAGNGATSINQQVSRGTSGPVGTFEGVTFHYVCDVSATKNFIAIQLGNDNGSTTTFISGDKAEDGTLSSIQTTETSGNYYESVGNFTANLDVIAMNDSVGKWVRFDLGGFSDSHSGAPCNIWGVVIPAS